MLATRSRERWQGGRGKGGAATLGIIHLLTNVGVASMAPFPGDGSEMSVGLAPRSRLLG